MRERIAPVTPMHECTYKDMFQGIPDLVYVLGGGVKDVPKDPMKYISPPYLNKKDTVGGGFWRMYAATDLAHTFPQMKIITSGGTYYPGFKPSAAVIAHDLGRFGIAQDRIEQRSHALTTSMEIADVIMTTALLTNTPETGEKIIVVTTNDFHIPRSRLMFEKILSHDFGFLPKDRYEDFEQFSKNLSEAVETYKNNNVQVIFASSESIILVRHPDFIYGFERIHKRPEYKNMQRLERNGIEDLLRGRYSGTVRY